MAARVELDNRQHSSQAKQHALHVTLHSYAFAPEDAANQHLVHGSPAKRLLHQRVLGMLTCTHLNIQYSAVPPCHDHHLLMAPNVHHRALWYGHGE